MKGAAAAAILSFAAAGSAHAAINVTTSAGAPDPGQQAGETILFDFEAATPQLSGDFALVNGSLSGVYAAPAGNTSQYLVVPGLQNASGYATLDLTGVLAGQYVDTFSFYWGSVDTYNTLELYDKNNVFIGKVEGGTLPPANGDQVDGNSNIRVNFGLTGADRNLGYLKFYSDGKAFELDDIAFATSAVPEPATWAMMIAGFGMAGAAIRRRRTTFAVA
ncbi:PEPxxWA-CTERM sorting domain-containing protein [Phenylobacterium sp.]|uniref:Npun_F0296 family exosortase-dependent surface protein n=1 Tax=Phenylobacterium sp. TaxID=1871053 RepID=UPI0035B41B00